MIIYDGWYDETLKKAELEQKKNPDRILPFYHCSRFRAE
jgi:hypothetical protein